MDAIEPRVSPWRRRFARGTALAGLAAGAWTATAAHDRHAVERDPERDALFAPLAGRADTVRSTDGTELHVETFGPEDAPTIVLVHGWTCALRFWTRQIQALSPDFRVVAYDVRGHGRSTPPATGDYSVTALADDLERVLETAVPDGRPALVAGHSLGGMTVVAWALHHPDSVKRLSAAALVNTGMSDLIAESLIVPIPSPMGRAKQLVGRAFLEAPSPGSTRPTPISRRVVGYVTCGPRATPAQVAFCEQMVLACGPDTRVGFGRTLTRMDVRAGVAGLGVPTLVVGGRRDRMTPLVHAERLAAQLPRCAELALFDTGHMGPVEAADGVTAALRRLAEAELTGARAGTGEAAAAAAAGSA